MHKQKAKSFPLLTSESIEKLLDNINKEPEITEKLFFRDKLGLKRAKTIKDPDLPYNNESQRALDIFTRQVNNVFFAKQLTYTIKQDKCRYARGFLRSIFADDWETYNQQNLMIDDS